MTLEDAIVEWLKADAGVTALVGQEVYQLVLPQSPTLPAVRVQLIGHPLLYHLRGGGILSNARIQVDAFADITSGGDAYADVADVADAVDAALSGRRFWAGGTPPAVQVTGAFRIDRRPLYEAEELTGVRMLQDYSVWARLVG